MIQQAGMCLQCKQESVGRVVFALQTGFGVMVVPSEIQQVGMWRSRKCLGDMK